MVRPIGVTRREFIQTTAIAAVGTTLTAGAAVEAAGPDAATSTVVLVRDPAALDPSGAVRGDIVAAMLDRGVTTLTGIQDAAAAWRSLVKPADVVGIKSNVWNYLPTPKALEQAIGQRVVRAGVGEERLSVDDRGVRQNAVFQRATALINTRPMRSHHWSGVGGLIKNYIMYVETPSDMHADACADLATVWYRPEVKGKTRLNVLVLLTPQFHGVGPHSFSPQYVWKYNGLAIGFDPVAVDSVGLRIIQAKRRIYFEDDRPLNPPAKHIQLADTRHHLGTADPARINLVVLGDRDGLLL
jgi:hypothetical protein